MGNSPSRSSPPLDPLSPSTTRTSSASAPAADAAASPSPNSAAAARRQLVRRSAVGAAFGLLLGGSGISRSHLPASFSRRNTTTATHSTTSNNLNNNEDNDDDIGTFVVDGGSTAPCGSLYPSAPKDYARSVLRARISARRLAPFYSGLESDTASPPTPPSHFPIALDAHALPTHPLKSIVPSSILINKSSSFSKLDQHPAISPDPSATTAPPDASATTTDPPPHIATVIIAIASIATLPQLHPPHQLNSSRSVSEPTLSIQRSFDPASASNARPNLKFELLEITTTDLFKDPVECPICFLYYPRNINFTRCCEQPICTDCFIQIKRPQPSYTPAECPYCVVPNFGVVYHPIGSPEYRQRYNIDPHALPFTVPKEIAHMSAVADTTTNTSHLPADATGNSAAVNSDAKPPSNTTPSDTLHVPVPVSMPSPSSPSAPALDSASNSSSPHVSSSEKSAAQSPQDRRRKSFSQYSPVVVLSDELRPNWRQLQAQAEVERITNQRRQIIPGAFQRPAMSMMAENEITTAATAAAELLETYTRLETASTSTERRAARRAVRNSTNSPSTSYINAIRHMGADIEELMIMEAIRQSMREADEADAVAAIAASEAAARDEASAAASEAAAQEEASAATAAASSSSDGEPQMPIQAQGAMSSDTLQQGQPLASVQFTLAEDDGSINDGTTSSDFRQHTQAPPSMPDAISTITQQSQPVEFRIRDTDSIRSPIAEDSADGDSIPTPRTQFALPDPVSPRLGRQEHTDASISTRRYSGDRIRSSAMSVAAMSVETTHSNTPTFDTSSVHTDRYVHATIEHPDPATDDGVSDITTTNDMILLSQGVRIVALSNRNEEVRRRHEADDAVSFDSLAARKSLMSVEGGDVGSSVVAVTAAAVSTSAAAATAASSSSSSTPIFNPDGHASGSAAIASFLD